MALRLVLREARAPSEFRASFSLVLFYILSSIVPTQFTTFRRPARPVAGSAASPGAYPGKMLLVCGTLHKVRMPNHRLPIIQLIDLARRRVSDHWWRFCMPRLRVAHRSVHV